MDDAFVMGSSPASVVHYCCVFDGRTKKNFCYDGGDDRTESLADLCLENAPPFHSWYFHSTRRRTYGFLMEKGLTYLVIANSGICSQELLKFLRYVRDGYKKFSESEEFQQQGMMIPIVRQLIATLEKVPRSDFFDQMASDGNRPSPSEEPGTPLLGRNKHDRKKERASDGGDDDATHRVNSPEPTGTICLQKSPSADHAWSQHTARRLWLRQVKMVILADVLLCFILLMIWLMICRGLECINNR